MAIDLLCCHLGISEQEARTQLGLEAKEQTLQQIVDTQHSLMGLSAEK
ncbi:heat shock protein HtpX [Vibrio cholerae HC-02A1]|nr:heat shock protein HtpX [Vibrio cholerae HC-02A1]EKG62978.1 heat shock protein HtpX [Vibrio cholerae HC-55A1]